MSKSDYIRESLKKSRSLNHHVIYVGDFSHFEERDTNAAYENGAIYIINVQDNAMDMADDIVHEIAHARGKIL